MDVYWSPYLAWNGGDLLQTWMLFGIDDIIYLPLFFNQNRWYIRVFRLVCFNVAELIILRSSIFIFRKRSNNNTQRNTLCRKIKTEQHEPDRKPGVYISCALVEYKQFLLRLWYTWCVKNQIVTFCRTWRKYNSKVSVFMSVGVAVQGYSPNLPWNKLFLFLPAEKSILIFMDPFPML